MSVPEQTQYPATLPAAPRIAVLIPCHNEAASIGKVVSDFRRALPDAQIHVYDNNSTDGTAALARAAGAMTRRESQQGKGHVVRRMFADIEADIYILVDGDDTYDASMAPALAQRLLADGLDMVNASRIALADSSYRPGHRLGNRLLSGLVIGVFGAQLQDLLSGYRVFSRRFVKSFPCLATGFEIEIELTVHALELAMPVAEIPTRYGARPAGSTSKLHTISDGLRILGTILKLIKAERPMRFFLAFFALLTTISLVLIVPVLETYWHSGLVPRLPTALLATAMMLLAFLSLVCGMILETVTRGRRETKRMSYLGIPLYRDMNTRALP